MLISFIIPVYNVEKYLEECVNSVLSQSFKDYEIILIDDGSTDLSAKICDEYAKKYQLISVIHKENGGLSDARNTGIKVAKGDYIMFLDSDDYIGTESLIEIVNCLKNNNKKVDIMFLEAIKFYPNGLYKPMKDGYISNIINNSTKCEVMRHLSNLNKFPGSACTKLVRRRLLEENGIYFEKGLVSEDIDWSIRLLKVAKIFLYCDVKYYYYRQNRIGSITHKASIKSLESLLFIINRHGDENIKYDYQREINSFLSYEYIIILLIYANLNKQNKENIKKNIKDTKWIAKYGTTKKEKLVYYALSIFGINITSKLLKWYRKYQEKRL